MNEDNGGEMVVSASASDAELQYMMKQQMPGGQKMRGSMSQKNLMPS